MNLRHFVLFSVSENPFKDVPDVNEIDLREYQVIVKTEKEKIKRGYSRVQERVKNLRQKFSEAVTVFRRSGSGQIKTEYYDELVKIWGGSPASEPLSYGSSTDNINTDNSLSDDSNNINSSSLSPTISTKKRKTYNYHC